MQVKSTFPVKLFATNVVLLVPVPDQTARATFNLSAGGFSVGVCLHMCLHALRGF